jgi:hypothetical protein
LGIASGGAVAVTVGLRRSIENQTQRVSAAARRHPAFGAPLATLSGYDNRLALVGPVF